MDPKSTAQLDPKLKEAYDRVMGTPTAASPANPTPQAVTPPSAISSTPASTPSQVTPAAAQPAEPALPVAPVVMPHSTETVRIGGNTPTEPAATPIPSGVVAKSPSKGIPPAIIILGAVVFLIVYSVFWVKFLNISLPFLNQ